MATTYTVSGIALTFGNNKSLLSIFNGTGSGKIVRVYRVTILNNQTVAIANGVITTIEMRKLTASSGGSSLTAIKHDTSSGNLESQIAITSGATDTVAADIYRRFMWSTDEPASTTSTIDEWECIPIFNTIWDSGYQDTNLDPIVLRENQGLAIIQPGANTLGLCDIFVEFTTAAS